MNYGELHNEYQALEREMKDKINGMQKLHGMIAKKMGNGDLKSFRRNIASLESTVVEEARALSVMKELEADPNPQEYFGDGEFIAQMLEACGKLGVDVEGELPVYKVFPYRVKIDTENQDPYLDRKKMQCVRPKSFTRQVETGQDELTKASFSAPTFANELADVYDLVPLKLEEQPGADIYLISLYKLLAPMGRSRRDYDQRSYAFNLTGFYDSGIKEIKDGRRIQFGSSRKGDKAIRILGSQGREGYLSTIRFFR